MSEREIERERVATIKVEGQVEAQVTTTQATSSTTIGTTTI